MDSLTVEGVGSVPMRTEILQAAVWGEKMKGRKGERERGEARRKLSQTTKKPPPMLYAQRLLASYAF